MLSESLPSAVGIAAKAMGVTTQQLFKMMEQGQIIASDFLPKFTKELRSAVREGDALGQGLNTSRVAMQKFGTAFRLNILDSFDAGLESGLADFFNRLTASIEDGTPIFRVIGKVLGEVLSLVGTAALAFTQMVRPLGMFFDSIIVGSEKSAEKVGVLTRMFNALLAVVLIPFSIMEQLNDYVANMNGSMKSLASGGLYLLNIGLGYLSMRMLGISSGIAGWLSGFKMLTLVMKGLSSVAKMAFVAIQRHPVMAMITGLLAVKEWIDSLETDGYSDTLKSKIKGMNPEDSNLQSSARSAYAGYMSSMADVAGYVLGDNVRDAMRKWIQADPMITGGNTIQGDLIFQVSGSDPKENAKEIRSELDNLFTMSKAPGY